MAETFLPALMLVVVAGLFRLVAAMIKAKSRPE